MKLLPLQGAKLTALIPRVLPWARSFCPFRAYGCNPKAYSFSHPPIRSMISCLVGSGNDRMRVRCEPP